MLQCAGMGIEVIRVGRNDSLASIAHLLESATEQSVLIHVPFGNGHILGEQVDMARLKQAASDRGINVGIVSVDGRARNAAAVMRLPNYSTIMGGRLRHGRARPWWMPEERRVGERTHISEADKKAVNRRIAPKPRWLTYSYRYLVIFSFLIILAGLLVTVLYVIPRATIVLKPEIRAIEVTQQIVADPRFDESEASGATVPGRLLVFADTWRTSVEPTGVRNVPALPARGLVTFVNRVPSAATIPAGTRVSTSSGQRVTFQTMQTIELPARIGAEADVEVVALNPGPSGNLPPDRINRIDGTLSAQLNVRNLFELSGGADRSVKAVSRDDMDRLRDHVVETLFAQAIAEMRSELTNGELLAEESLRMVAIYEENFSHFVNEETDELTFEMRAELHGTAVNAELAIDLIDEQIVSAVPDGYRLLDDTVNTTLGELQGVDAQGRVSLLMNGYALVAAEIRVGDGLERIEGQSVELASYYFEENLPLREEPEVRVWPARFDRMPYLSSRMRTVIDTTLE